MSPEINIPSAEIKPAGWVELFYDMVEYSAIAQFYVDSSGIVAYLNRQGHDVLRGLESELGFGPEQLVNGPVQRLSDAIPELQSALQGEDAGPVSRHATVGDHWLKWNVARIRGTDDRPAGAAISLEIITDEQQLIAGLQREVQGLTKTLTTTASRIQETSAVVTETIPHVDIAQQALQQSSEIQRSIRDGVQAISLIAHQTNLLALNTTIAAAKSAETGSRLTCVVSEIKNLARRTAKAAEVLSGLVASLQDSTTTAETALSSFSARLRRIHDLAAAIAPSKQES